MAIGHRCRSEFFFDQKHIANFWCHQAMSSKNEFLTYACFYSALNALAWACSNKTRDGQIFTDLIKRLYGNGGTDRPAFIFEARQMIYKVCRNFPNGVHNLAEAFNDIAPEEKSFEKKDSQHIFKISEISPLSMIEKMREDDVIFLAIKLIYQFRCNLVHGTKEPGEQANIEVIISMNRTISSLVDWIYKTL